LRVQRRRLRELLGMKGASAESDKGKGGIQGKEKNTLREK